MATSETSIPVDDGRVTIATGTLPGTPIRLCGSAMTPTQAWRVARELLRTIGDVADREATAGDPIGLPRSAWACIDAVD